MKNKSIIYILIILLLLIAIKFLWLTPNAATQGKGKNPGNTPANVTAIVATPGQLEQSIYASGTITAINEVMLHPEVSGRLVSLNFEEGKQVEKGTLLAKINDQELRAQLMKLQVQRKLAAEKFSRLKSLLQLNGVSQEEADEADNQVQAIDADIAYTAALIAKTEVRAPFSGTIGLRQVSEGSLVNPTTLIANLQQRDFLKVDFSVPEKYSAIIAVGDKIEFTVDNVKDTFTANVIALDARIDEASRNIQVRANFKNQQAKLLPGSFARVKLITEKQANAILIPTEAVIPELKGKKVYLVKQGKAMPAKVQTGYRSDSHVEISSGIQVGDTIIVTGIMSLKPEAPVKVIRLISK